MTAFYLVLFLGATCISGTLSTASFPEDLYPKSPRTEFRLNCPQLYGKFESCSLSYEDCFGTLRTIDLCGNKFCECIKVNEGSKTKCGKYADDACFAVHERGRTFHRLITEKRTKPAVHSAEKRIKSIVLEYKKFQKECEIESKIDMEVNRLLTRLNSTNGLLNLTMPFFALHEVESSLSKSEKCENAIERFQNILKEVDSKTADNLQIPFDFWFLGAEYGSVGRVITRSLGDELCKKAAVKLNHYGVVHLNGYDERRNQEECDKEYLENIKHTLSTTDSKKLDCKLFVDLLDSIQTLRGDDLYKEALEYDVPLSRPSMNAKLNNGFEEFKSGSMTNRDTKSLLFILEATDKSNLRIQDSFARVSHNCPASRNIVASCGLQYRQCIDNNQEECKIRLSICLTDTIWDSEECEAAVKHITNLLFPSTFGSIKNESSMEIDSGIEWKFGVAAIFFFFIVLIIVILVLKVCKTTNPSKSIEENETADTPNSVCPESEILLSEVKAEKLNDEDCEARSDSGISVSEIDHKDNNSVPTTLDEEIPIIPEAKSNNQRESPGPEDMKTDDDSVHSFRLQS